MGAVAAEDYKHPPIPFPIGVETKDPIKANAEGEICSFANDISFHGEGDGVRSINSSILFLIPFVSNKITSLILFYRFSIKTRIFHDSLLAQVRLLFDLKFAISIISRPRWFPLTRNMHKICFY